MKIAIGTNIFGRFHRQDMCIKSLIRIKSQFPSIVDLYNIQSDTDPQQDDGFITLPSLKRTCRDVIPNSQKNKPMMKDMFGALCDLGGYDYFVFTNSDIIMSDRFIRLIMDNQDKDSFSGSRVAIKNIDSLDSRVELIQYQVAGFDTFAIKPNWWNTHKDKFPDYVYAEPCWDVHYATILKRFGNSMFVNKWPAALFHIHHDIAWSDMTPERQYNETMLFKANKSDSDMWHTFLYNVLLKRSPYQKYYTAFENEELWEDKIFHE